MHHTTKLFEQDAYLQHCTATIISVNDSDGIVTNQTVFYPAGGGQPGDIGMIRCKGAEYQIENTIKDRNSGEIVHLLADGEKNLYVGDKVELVINWENRYLNMRMHSALHLLCAVVPCGVTGGQIGAKKSRLDFDIGESTLDKLQITDELNLLVEQAHDVTTMWVDEQTLVDNPELVRTMSVKPPKNSGKVRLLKVGEQVDLQPCGGTHIRNTKEIGKLRVSKIENKGKRNRRVNIVFSE